MDNAYEYAIENPLMKALQYPYTGADTGKCNYDKEKGFIKITGFKSVEKNKEQLKAALNQGPVSVAI